MKKTSSRVPLLVALLVIATGALYLVKRREARQRGAEVVEATGSGVSAPTSGAKKNSRDKQSSVSPKVREDALKAIAASRQADDEQAAENDKARTRLAKVMPVSQAQEMLGQLQKTFVNGKPTAATQKLAREMASRQGFKEAKKIATAYTDGQTARSKKLVETFSPTLKAEADKGYKANVKAVWEKKKP